MPPNDKDKKPSLEELQKQIEELKKGQLTPEQKTLLEALKILNVKNPDDLQAFIQPQSSSEKEDDEDTKDKKKEDETLKDRLDRMEKEKKEEDFQKIMAKNREILANKILEEKSKYPYLATKVKDEFAMNNIIMVAENFKQKTGQFPNIDELFKAQNDSFKSQFENTAKELGLDPEAVKVKIEEDAKKDDKTDDKKEDGKEDDKKDDKKEEKDDKTDDKKEEEKDKDTFELKSPSEIEKLPKAQQFKYFFDEAEAKEQNKKMVKAEEKKEEKTDDKKEETSSEKDEKTDDKSETKDGKKVVMSSGGETEADSKPAEEKSEDELQQEKMREAGFPID